MTEPCFDELIHAPVRLRLCAMLAGSESVEFGVLRDELDISNSALSKHLKTLGEAGYTDIVLRGSGGRGRPKSWVQLTANGRHALRGHLAELQRLAAQVH